MEGCEFGDLLHRRNHIPINNHRFGEVLPAVNHPVTYGVYLAEVADGAAVGGCERLEDEIEGDFVVGHRLGLLDVGTARPLVLENGIRAAAHTDAVRDAGGQRLFSVCFDEFVLQR